MPQRPRKYAQISFETRERLIEAITRGQSMKTTCNILQIPLRSGQRIHANYVAHGELIPNRPRGGQKTRKLTDAQIEEIRSWIDEDCQITINEMKIRILAAFGVRVSDGTICNYIKSFQYTFKKVAKIPYADETPELWDDRVIYSRWYTEQKVLGKTFLYLDEVGFQVFILK